MLDKLSRQIISYMIEHDKESGGFYAFDEDLDIMAESLSVDSEDARAALRYLESKAYVKIEGYTFFLEHRGRRKKEINRLETIDFLLKSILTPIVVAFLTTILTVNLWPRVLHWLQELLSATQ